MGRWPEHLYNIFEYASENSSITDIELGTETDWTGSEVVIRKNGYSLDRCRITDHTENILIYNSLGSKQNAFPNHGYFIQNDLRTLSHFGEWYHNTSSGKFYVYFGTTDPSTRKIKVATLNTLILNNGYDYITIDGLHLEGSISHALTYISASDYCTIKNSILCFAGLDGIHLLGKCGTINNNLISNCNQTGIITIGDFETIISNNIKNIGLVPGQALDGSLTSGILITNNECIIKNNNIENIGYCGIALSSIADIITIENNYINNVLLVLNDGGGIYTVAEGISRKIDGNIIMNVQGNLEGTNRPDRPIARGIYLDENSSNVIVTNNTVAHCSEAGYMIHRGKNNIIKNNTAFNNASAMYFQNSFGSGIRDNQLNGNIFIAKSLSQTSLNFASVADDIPAFGTADNNYYARPVDDKNVFYTYSPATGYKYRTLEELQDLTGQDLNSKKSPVLVTDTASIDFYFNATTSNKVISLSQPMIDIKGTKYKNSITLLPYTSVILMPDPNPDQPVIPVYSSSVIENSAPNILVISYNNELSVVVPPASSFYVVVNGITRKITDVSISGNKVFLALESRIISGDDITFVYNKPSTNPLQTPSGGQAASVSNQTVENNCTGSNQPPIILISSPTKGSILSSPATFIIDITASDPDGTISKVELFNGNTKICELTSAPYSFTLKDLISGNYSITAVATDNLKSSTSSGTLEFQVITYNTDREILNLYPNPNNGYFSIDFTVPNELQFENYIIVIANLSGKTVYQNNMVNTTEITQFDLSHLDPGTYIVMIKSDLILVTQKFIKT